MYQNLYVHIPFCQSKCGYCSFYSIPAAGKELFEEYVSSMERRMAGCSIAGAFDTVYFGGGTPSALPTPLFERLFLAVNAYFEIAPEAEISVECNPETIDEYKGALISAFANRISLGVQSFSQDMRKFLGRNANDHDVKNAVKIFRKYHVNRLNIDLIYAIPGQTLADWIEELKIAVDMGFEHISCYSLTVEEGTPLAEAHGVDVVDEELSAEMWHATGEFLRKYGLRRYEISNYACAGQECRHNMNVWHGGTYLGFGPAASSFDGKTRWTQAHDLRKWLLSHSPEIDEISVDCRADEILAFGLRTADGWTEAQWNSLLPEIRAVLPWEAIGAHRGVSELREQGLLLVEPGHIRPSDQGMAFWDNIAAALI